jgi:hypothetical protein
MSDAHLLTPFTPSGSRRARLAMSVCVAATLYSAACASSPTAPTQPPVAAISETAHYVFHHGSDDGVDASWQETYHA